MLLLLTSSCVIGPPFVFGGPHSLMGLVELIMMLTLLHWTLVVELL